MNNLIRMAIILFLMIFVSCTPSPKEFEKGFIMTSDGVQLFYCLVGTGPDTVIVPAATYLSQKFARFSPGRTLIFYDPRNRGRSEAVSDTTHLGIQYELADLDELCQHFRIKRMSLIGWSYLGAMVALYAADHPEQVDRVVQIGPIPPLRNPYWHQYEKVHAARMDSLGLGCLQNMQQIIEDMTPPATYRKMKYRLRLAAMLANPKTIEKIQGDYLNLENKSLETVNFILSKIHVSLGDWDWRDELSSLLMPTLTIQGEQDPLPMEGAIEWVKILPNARLFKISDSGHLPFVEQPDIFYPAVEQFLNGEWPDGS